MDRVGFKAIDFTTSTHMGVAMRYKKEDPWERMRHVRKLITRTPINAIVRGQSLWTFEVFPNDVVELAIERLRANGITQLAIYDQFNDLANVEVCVAKANELGLMVTGLFAHEQRVYDVTGVLVQLGVLKGKPVDD